MKLDNIKELDNILDKLTKKEKQEITAEVTGSVDDDTKQHAERIQTYEEIIKTSRSKVTDPVKNHPWEKASNIKIPMILADSNSIASMISTAVLQDEIVKGVVIGKDSVEVNSKQAKDGKTEQPLGKQDRADRMAEYVNYLLKSKIPDWEETQDYLFSRSALLGSQFKKTYWCPIDKVVKSELINYDNIIISESPTLETADRITHTYSLTMSEIIGRQRAGIYSKVDLEEKEDANYEILETHTWYDLDDDGIKEPYIITHIKSGELLSIQKRFDNEDINYNDKKEVISIKPVEYFTKYGFIRDTENPIYDIGFGQLLMPMNKTSNTIVNQLIDAGTLANTSGGIIGGGSGIRSGNSMKLKMGEWKVLTEAYDLKANIVPIQGSEPSPTLFALLGSLTQASKDITSINSINPESIGANTPATTTLYMIEQGLTELKAIYNRIRRSMKEETKKILYFTEKFGDVNDYIEDMDFGQASKEDWTKRSQYEIVPINGTDSLTRGQSMMRANAVYEMAIAGNNPFMSLEEATEYMLKALKIDNFKNLMQEPPQQQPNPIEQAMAQNQVELGKAQNLLLNAQAGSIEQKTQLDKMKLAMDNMIAKIDARNKTVKTNTDAIAQIAKAQETEESIVEEKEIVDKYSGTLTLPKAPNPFEGGE